MPRTPPQDPGTFAILYWWWRKRPEREREGNGTQELRAHTHITALIAQSHTVAVKAMLPSQSRSRRVRDSKGPRQPLVYPACLVSHGRLHHRKENGGDRSSHSWRTALWATKVAVTLRATAGPLLRGRFSRCA